MKRFGTTTKEMTRLGMTKEDMERLALDSVDEKNLKFREIRQGMIDCFSWVRAGNYPNLAHSTPAVFVSLHRPTNNITPVPPPVRLLCAFVCVCYRYSNPSLSTLLVFSSSAAGKLTP